MSGIFLFPVLVLSLAEALSKNGEVRIMNLVNTETGEILEIKRGGLYAALPIPAYKILAQAKEHVAKDVLVCLVSHLGRWGAVCYPSYSTIARETGRSRNSIRSGLQVLYDFGFVRVYQVKQGKRLRNKYYIQQACYSTKLMNKAALRFLPKIATCLRCRERLSSGEIGFGKENSHHYGCGGITTLPLADYPQLISYQA